MLQKGKPACKDLAFRDIYYSIEKWECVET